jgi:hypothetical protein
MHRAGIRPLTPGHHYFQGTAAVLHFAALPASCTPEVIRASDAQIEMQLPGKRVWANVAARNGIMWQPGNVDSSVKVFGGPNHAWPDYWFNECEGGHWRKVRMVIMPRVRDSQSHRLLGESRYTFPVKVHGSCAEAHKSKRLTANYKEEWGDGSGSFRALGARGDRPQTNAIGTASTIPQINAYFTDRPVEPTWFTPAPSYLCGNADTHFVDQIVWSSWGGETATGTGVAGGGCEAFRPDGTTYPVGPAQPSPVTVTLGGKQECAGFTIYTTDSLELAPGAPEPAFWPRLRTGRAPCNAGAPGCTADQLPGHFEAHGPADCALRLERLVGHRKLDVGWQPRTPPGTVPQLRRLLAAKWSGWGQATTVGRGALLDQHPTGHGRETDLLWPAEVELSDPTWCPRLGEHALNANFGNPISYTSLKLTLYGSGLPETKNRAYNARLMIQARELAGQAGLPTRVFRQHVPIPRTDCGF